MKRNFILWIAVPLLAMVLVSCELEEEDSGPAVNRADVEDLNEVSNSDATIVTSTSEGETLVGTMLDEIYSVLDSQISASQGGSISLSNALRASAVEENTDSDSWDEEIVGPQGGTARTQGNWSRSFRLETPDEESLPFTVNARSSTSDDETTTFEEFAWNSTSQSGSYQFSGGYQIDFSSSSDTRVTVSAVDADNEPSEFDASLAFSIGGGISVFGTAEPVTGNGDAIRFIFYVTFNQSENFAYDETDVSSLETSFAGAVDESAIEVSGSLQVFDASGSEVAAKTYSSFDELEAAGVFQ